MSGPTQRGLGNSGVQNTGGGTVNISQSAIGDHPTIRIRPAPEHAPRPPASTETDRWDVGVITVLSEETRAVAAVLAAAGTCRKQTHPNGLRFCEADIGTTGGHVKVVATQALDRGQRPAVIAFESLRQHYAPAVVVLVGIAGGINPAVRLGDVVVVQEVIYYDLRKESLHEIFRRGQARPVPAAIRRAINDFFSYHGEPYRASIEDQDGTLRTCNVLPGPIGSGEAVIAHKDSDVRQYVASFNDKTLALETEGGGLAEAFYEMADVTSAGSGWLAIRGISDHADAAKDDSYHDIASWHAATILRQLLPYLKPDGNTTG
jgi:adenosylhomocysteine nucleosidase